MNYLINFLAIIGGFYLVGRLWATIKTVWATRGTMFNSVLDQVSTITKNKGATEQLKKFCEPMLPKEEEKEIKNE